MGNVVNGLWIQGKLSSLELLTIHSFTKNGFTFRLWTYEPSGMNAPEGIEVRDASEIVPRENVFTYRNSNIHGHGKNSYAGFSDIFRYRLLYEYGGIWTDMDITCLKPFDLNTDYFFRHHHKAGAVGNFMKCPPKSALMEWCFAQANEQVNEHNKNWMLPIELLNEGIEKFNLKKYIGDISNPDSFPVVAKLLSASPDIPQHWMIIHWMNEEWRRFDLDKEAALDGSIYAQLLKRYQLPVKKSGTWDALRNRVKLNKLYYFLMCYYYIYRYKIKEIAKP